MGILSGNPKKQPLHYGEVYSMWSYLLVVKGDYAKLQTFSNHTGDRDLKKLLEEMTQASKKEIEELEEVLKDNGVGVPPAPPEKPYADLEDIPAGAKLSDPEISATASLMLGEGLVTCSTIISQCTREDLAMLFGQYHMNKAQVAAKALRLNKEKGWLVVPPMHTKVPNQES
ncbi:DUF3231 family protein [Tenuibacillus multivorans]|uniref:DUF3231 family protein n=1 Tax=Tenuibacillus multivorans TaxID=237069 RepID=A0A1H0AKD7_9BACI|nr:DUF3231 family protein [Tenuibacillus multivorans]GEL78183.1 membrane protein [Tenuibacillus multivorans]SDN33907.1 Protein of unknown function [Tenuibacillus multivorans]